MKSSVAVAVISLFSLVALLHPCHGIICYMCHSSNYRNPPCEKISGDECILDYGDEEEYCVKILFHKKAAPNVTEERLLVRGGLSDKGYKQVSKVMANHRKMGFEVDYFKCHEDRCNGD